MALAANEFNQKCEFYRYLACKTLTQAALVSAGDFGKPPIAWLTAITFGTPHSRFTLTLLRVGLTSF